MFIKRGFINTHWTRMDLSASYDGFIMTLVPLPHFLLVRERQKFNSNVLFMIRFTSTLLWSKHLMSFNELTRSRKTTWLISMTMMYGLQP